VLADILGFARKTHHDLSATQFAAYSHVRDAYADYGEKEPMRVDEEIPVIH